MELMKQLDLFPWLDAQVFEFVDFDLEDPILSKRFRRKLTLESTNQIDKQREVSILNWWDAE